MLNKKLFIGIALMSFLLVSGCAEPKYDPGSFVQTVIGDNVGQVLTAHCAGNRHTCRYKVRFNSLSIQTDTHLLGADGVIKFAPLTVINNMHEFELYKKREN